MKGKVIAIEGTDASGKATQSEKLFQRLSREGRRVLKVEYPNYESKSSTLVKMYLNGELGEDPFDINSYAASTFYAVDRYASFRREWKNFYEEGGIIIADRYTTSNMIHQAGKINGLTERDKFLDWLWDLEFIKFSLPVPDLVFFLDMPPEQSRFLMKNRDNKITGEKEKDIHEKNREHLEQSYNNACLVAEKYEWQSIACVVGDKLRPIESIHDEIYQQVLADLRK